MDGQPGGPSPALLAAQRRLEQLRQHVAATQYGAHRQPSSPSLAIWPEPPSRPAAESGQPAADQQLPATTPQSPTITLHPSLALAMLGTGQAAAGRLWLLLRHLDKQGQGWLSLRTIQTRLSGQRGELRLCSRRQLGNLLRQGRGIYWEIESGTGQERIWLRSAGRVAAALGVDRLTGRPVALPVEVLLGGMGKVRAHFYASFHSSKANNGMANNGTPIIGPASIGTPIIGPISRACLARITHVPARTQRAYEKKTGIMARANLALGPRYSPAQAQESAWRRGPGVFSYTDWSGRHGPAGQRYVAWRLPNSYRGCHAPASPGRKKKINRQIDLVTNRAQGNDCGSPAVPSGNAAELNVDRLFHPNGQAAGKAYNRSGAIDAYWSKGRAARNRPAIWHVLPGRPKDG